MYLIAGVSGNTGAAAATALLEKRLFKEMAHALETGTMRFHAGDARHVRGPTTLESVLAKLV